MTGHAHRRGAISGAWIALRWWTWLLVLIWVPAVCAQLPPVVGKWRYQSGSFTDIHVYGADGAVSVPASPSASATWSIFGNEVVVKWSNGWQNRFTLPVSGGRLSGVALGPGGERQSVTLSRIDEALSPAVPSAVPTAAPASLDASMVGNWRYESGSFNDVHVYTADGKVSAPVSPSVKATWSVSNKEVVVLWSSGWQNRLTLPVSGGRISGVAIGPGGQRASITLTRLSETPVVASLTGAWVHSASPNTQTPDNKVIVIQDGNRVTLTQSYKQVGTRYQWVTTVCSGTLSNGEVNLVCNWAPGGNPLGFASGSRLSMRISADGNHLDGTLDHPGGGSQESHYSRLP